MADEIVFCLDLTEDFLKMFFGAQPRTLGCSVKVKGWLGWPGLAWLGWVWPRLRLAWLARLDFRLVENDSQTTQKIVSVHQVDISGDLPAILERALPTRQGGTSRWGSQPLEATRFLRKPTCHLALVPNLFMVNWPYWPLCSIQS